MFILWRIKELIANGTLEAQGSIEKMKDFEVKMADAAPSEEAQTTVLDPNKIEP